MRIVITGASSVGKTTLAETLSSKLGLPMIAEVSRQHCQELGHYSFTEILDRETFNFQVLQKQIEAEDKLTSFVSDRSALDYWVFWQRWSICGAMSYDTEKFYNQAKPRAEKYTHVIYIPPLFAADDDGLRWTDPDYQMQFDRLVRMTLYEWGLWERTHTIKAEVLEERVNEVLAWLNK
jgi:nicotinamide riboside kinase